LKSSDDPWIGISKFLFHSDLDIGEVSLLVGGGSKQERRCRHLLLPMIDRIDFVMIPLFQQLGVDSLQKEGADICPDTSLCLFRSQNKSGKRKLRASVQD
jgi:hypothetical protein